MILLNQSLKSKNFFEEIGKRQIEEISWKMGNLERKSMAVFGLCQWFVPESKTMAHKKVALALTLELLGSLDLNGKLETSNNRFRRAGV
jgi:hypothetical protein